MGLLANHPGLAQLYKNCITGPTLATNRFQNFVSSKNVESPCTRCSNQEGRLQISPLQLLWNMIQRRKPIVWPSQPKGDYLPLHFRITLFRLRDTQHQWSGRCETMVKQFMNTSVMGGKMEGQKDRNYRVLSFLFDVKRRDLYLLFQESFLKNPADQESVLWIILEHEDIREFHDVSRQWLIQLLQESTLINYYLYCYSYLVVRSRDDNLMRITLNKVRYLHRSKHCHHLTTPACKYCSKHSVFSNRPCIAAQ